jgi:hypothetical protein
MNTHKLSCGSCKILIVIGMLFLFEAVDDHRKSVGLGKEAAE